MASELPITNTIGESKAASTAANSVDSFSKSHEAGMTNTTDRSAVQAKDLEAKGGMISEKSVPTSREGDNVVDVPIENEQVAPGTQSPGGDDYEYPTKWKLALITIALCLSVFCMALDNTIIATAIPRITDQFHALSDIGWYVSVYLLTTCAFQLIFGKIYAYYSIKWVFMGALFIFELGSLICAVAPNSTALIFGRAIAGLGSAGIFTGAILIVSYTVPLASRPMYMGMIGGMYGIASVAGPLMGGAFTDNPHLTWRWCFYINLPFGGVTALFLFLFFKSPNRQKTTGLTFLQKLDKMDLPGTAVFLPGVVCLLLALQWGGSKYPWHSWRIILLLVFAALLIITFVTLQIVRGEKSTVPPRVFKNRNIWGAATFAACLGAAFFIILYYLPIWFQAIKGASAVKSGIDSLPLILTMVIVSIVAGGLITTLGYYTPFMWLTVLCVPVGAGLLSTLKPDSGHAKWMGYQALVGIGIGAGFQQPLIVAQASLPLEDVPIGTAIMMFAQILGGALFASVAQNVFDNQLIRNVAKAVPGYDTAQLLTVGATQVQYVVDAAVRAPITLAYNDAITQTFYVSVAMSSLALFPLLFVQWKSVKGMQLTPGAA